MRSILCLNVGSGSLKAAGFTLRDGAPRREFVATHDRSAGDREIAVTSGDETRMLPLPDDGYPGAALRLLDHAETRLGGPVAVGHRIVHGGAMSGAPVHLTADVVARLARFAPLAPLHQEANLSPVRAIMEKRPDVAQIGAFDTSFHETMTETARRLPVAVDGPEGPLRRYGFHGLSYRAVSRRMAEHGLRRVVALHLGGGASVCAMLDGRSIDTTMGATPLAGPMMTTRSGSVDPGVLLYLMRRKGIGPEALEDLLWRGSGLKGTSGISSDLRDLIGNDDPAAARAVELFCTDLVRHVGAMAARLGGLDALVFTGGAGAGQPLIRRRVAAGFGWAGLMLDPMVNDGVNEDTVAPSGSLVSALGSPVQAWVLPVDEESEIARDVEQLCAVPA